jgi:hypothetical protein
MCWMGKYRNPHIIWKISSMKQLVSVYVLMPHNLEEQQKLIKMNQLSDDLQFW